MNLSYTIFLFKVEDYFWLFQLFVVFVYFKVFISLKGRDRERNLPSAALCSGVSAASGVGEAEARSPGLSPRLPHEWQRGSS